jgi:hypothetical protein
VLAPKLATCSAVLGRAQSPACQSPARDLGLNWEAVDNYGDIDDTPTNTGDDLEPNSTNEELFTSPERWNEIW